MLELQWRNDQEQTWSQMDMTFLMQGWRTSNMTLEGKAADEVAQGREPTVFPTLAKVSL